MATTSNFGWETPDDTDYVKDGAAAMRTLGNSIDSSMADLKGGTTGQVLSKATNADMDFAWVTQDDANAIQNTIVDAKGDLITATGADTPARLGVGTNGQFLTADSAEATGLKWTTLSGGDVIRITSQTFSGVSSVNVNDCFSSTYDNYWITINGATSSTASFVFMRLRVSGADDTGTNYDRQLIEAYGTSLSSSRGVYSSFEAVSRLNTSDINYGNIRIFGPNRAAVTNVTVHDNAGATGANAGIFVASYSHRLATAYTGFTIYPNTGTFSGTVRVYGYKNS